MGEIVTVMGYTRAGDCYSSEQVAKLRLIQGGVRPTRRINPIIKTEANQYPKMARWQLAMRREQVRELYVQNLDYHTIAERMQLSESTVRNDVKWLRTHNQAV